MKTMKKKLFWIRFRLWLLCVTAHEHAALYLQLLWSAVETIIKSLPF
jgi:hypothetical protein